LRFGVITAYPEEDWHSRRILESCARRGQAVAVAPTDFSLHASDGGGLRVLARGEDVRCFDAWLTPRALGEGGDPDFQCGVYRSLAELGLPVVNAVDSLLLAEDKVRTSWLLAEAGVPTPRFVAVQSVAEAAAALEELAVAAAKPPYGSLGIGIARIVAGDPSAPAVLAAMLEQHGVVYLQRFVEGGEDSARDLRLFVVGDRVVGAMMRVAPPGEFRTNIHQGGEARPHEPDEASAAAAVSAARTLGLEYAGVDILEGEDGPTVIEVNGTPLWEGILRATGRDMADEIVAHAEGLARGTKKRRAEWQTNRRAS
jgi:tetrahydromethanopterin:alpha-L-glutamate ligase